MQELTPRLTQADESQNHQQHRQWHDVFADKSPVFVAHGLRYPGRHLRIAPNVTPRSRWLRRKKVNRATGSKNSALPAAIVVQSVKPEPSCAGMNGGAVCAFRLVIISAKAYSFQAVIKQNTAVAAIPVADSGITIFRNACSRV